MCKGYFFKDAVKYYTGHTSVKRSLYGSVFPEITPLGDLSTLQQAVQGQPGMEWVNPIRTGIKKVRGGQLALPFPSSAFGSLCKLAKLFPSRVLVKVTA